MFSRFFVLDPVRIIEQPHLSADKPLQQHLWWNDNWMINDKMRVECYICSFQGDDVAIQNKYRCHSCFGQVWVTVSDIWTRGIWNVTTPKLVCDKQRVEYESSPFIFQRNSIYCNGPQDRMFQLHTHSTLIVSMTRGNPTIIADLMYTVDWNFIIIFWKFIVWS